MATFTEDFTRMRQDCEEAQEDRHHFFEQMRNRVEQLAEETRNDMARFRAEHNQMANGLRDHLKQLATDLKTGGGIFRKESNPRKQR